jgi:hypothetical protein
MSVHALIESTSQKTMSCDSGTLLRDAVEKLIAAIGFRAVLAKIYENDEMEINALRDIALASSAR